MEYNKEQNRKGRNLISDRTNLSSSKAQEKFKESLISADIISILEEEMKADRSEAIIKEMKEAYVARQIYSCSPIAGKIN